MRVGIIGAGPAGSLCASLLSQSGWDVALFDHRGPWEKPCGGGVTSKALARYPFLQESLENHREIRGLKVISPRNAQVALALREPLFIYSRTVLNRLLLDRAIAGGARFHQERALDFRRADQGWELRTERATHRVDFLVGADGVNSFVRKRLGSKFTAEDLMMTFGYRIPYDLGQQIEIRFFPEFLGYYWTFPRPQHVSAGICGRLSRHSTQELKARLHQFLGEAGYLAAASETQRWEIYSALIPSLRPKSLRHNVVGGDGWALVGDAAGFVDPITCEGIYFAMRSGELLANALMERQASSYPDRCREDFGADFVQGAELFERFYTGGFLGADFITRMVQTTARSRTLQQVVRTFVAGRQDYRSLRSTLVLSAPRILLDMVASTLQRY